MAPRKPRSCPKHANDVGKYNGAELNTISALMSKLPNNQGFPGRHKCAYCGYRLGFDDGYAAALRDFEEQLNSLRN